DTLLGAMWLQCARVLSDNPTFKACEHCGKRFELAADKRRRNSLYCSDRCKVAAHRARRAIIPMTCDHCHSKFKVAITVRSGYSQFADVECPKCHAQNNRLMMGDIRSISE
ncbi:MAG TPA: hypothetical protein VG222_04240, partial [Vicinamibacterales bacterium]|nr:hypothetical protein [Vicinamibacterales bacterium]